MGDADFPQDDEDDLDNLSLPPSDEFEEDDGGLLDTVLDQIK